MPDERPPNGTREQPLGVAEVVRLAGRVLDGVGLVWLEGEVTQVSKAGSGHMYFSLADRGTVLAAVMWYRDAARCKFDIAPGKRLRVRGRVGVYDRDGKMQLYVDFAEPAGFGAEAAALEALKQKLAAEGMFAQAKKRPLPRFPKRIGVVTSKNGAAIHDIIRTVQRRFPTPILIADAMVQGPLAPAQLVAGMAMVVKAGVDVLIIGRGGGAATDLTAFNHERVVRTISRCPVPVVCAVGHETDLSLADLAADVRCSTPTAAAEHVVPDGRAIHEAITKMRKRLDREVRHLLDRARLDLDRTASALAAAHPRRRIEKRRAALGELIGRRDAAIRRRIERGGAELGALAAKLHALSPLAVLERGYAMVEREGIMLRAASDALVGDRLHVRLASGELDVLVEKVGKR